MDSSQTMTALFGATYRSLRCASDEASFAGRSTEWPHTHMSRKLEQLRATYELLPPSWRQRAWVLTSLQRASRTERRDCPKSTSSRWFEYRPALESE